MLLFPNLSVFYEDWRKDIVSRGVKVCLSTELVTLVKRNRNGVLVKFKNRTPMPGNHNPVNEDPDAPLFEEQYDEIVICTLADTAKKMLGKTATFREKRVLGSTKFSDGITVTHTDSDYMRKHYENFYNPSPLAVTSLSGVSQTSRCETGKESFKPMYYIKKYPRDQSKLEMCFDCTNYQAQFPPPDVAFDDHVFQTIFLNKDRDSKHWSIDEIDEAKVIRKDWLHQLCHSYTHYLFAVPWIMFLQGRKRTRFAALWTLFNAHEVAVLSGIVAAVDLGAEYLVDLERDGFVLLCFRAYYLLAYGK